MWYTVYAAKKFQSTPSARRATYPYFVFQRRMVISIHALREEGDFLIMYYRYFSNRFQSTPSARRATE